MKLKNYDFSQLNAMPSTTPTERWIGEVMGRWSNSATRDAAPPPAISHKIGHPDFRRDFQRKVAKSPGRKDGKAFCAPLRLCVKHSVPIRVESTAKSSYSDRVRCKTLSPRKTGREGDFFCAFCALSRPTLSVFSFSAFQPFSFFLFSFRRKTLDEQAKRCS
jgi:hypothetical protein